MMAFEVILLPLILLPTYLRICGGGCGGRSAGKKRGFWVKVHSCDGAG